MSSDSTAPQTPSATYTAGANGAHPYPDTPNPKPAAGDSGGGSGVYSIDAGESPMPKQLSNVPDTPQTGSIDPRYKHQSFDRTAEEESTADSDAMLPKRRADWSKIGLTPHIIKFGAGEYEQAAVYMISAEQRQSTTSAMGHYILTPIHIECDKPRFPIHQS
jgi:hypothetical protein